MSNVKGMTFQERIINKFEINQYLTYLKNIVIIVDEYQNSKYKLVHYDLSPWNVILGDNITIIDYEKSYVCFCIDEEEKDMRCFGIELKIKSS